MKNTTQQKEGTVKHTKDVINIDDVTPDNNRKENLVTTDFEEALKDKVEDKAPLTRFPNEDNKTNNDESEQDKKKR